MAKHTMNQAEREAYEAASNNSNAAPSNTPKRKKGIDPASELGVLALATQQRAALKTREVLETAVEIGIRSEIDRFKASFEEFEVTVDFFGENGLTLPPANYGQLALSPSKAPCSVAEALDIKALDTYEISILEERFGVLDKLDVAGQLNPQQSIEFDAIDDYFKSLSRASSESIADGELSSGEEA